MNVSHYDEAKVASDGLLALKNAKYLIEKLDSQNES